MSDRRPEKLLKQHPTMMGGQTGVHSFLPAIVEATLEDVIDFVRRGVESGEIGGEVAEVRPKGWPYIQVTEPGDYIVILVSDGGSET